MINIYLPQENLTISYIKSLYIVDYFMKKIIKITLCLLVAISTNAFQKSIFNEVVYETNEQHIGDILYLHGLGDKSSNHPRLFKEWNDIGYRVISFDYPNHGRTLTPLTDDLNFYTMKKLSNVATNTLKKYRLDNSKKLVIAGWSTGGILAIRAIQQYFPKEIISQVTHAILFAPGVSVKLCPGNKFCNITNFTLSDDTSLSNRSISPKSPLLRPAFGINLIVEGRKSFSKYPKNIKTLVFSASKNDHYVKTEKIHQWVKYQKGHGNKNIELISCPKSKHELDNNLDSSGSEEVRKSSAYFLLNESTQLKHCKSI